MRSAHHLVGLAFLGLSSTLLLGGPVGARDASTGQAACERDVRRLCSGSDAPDERRIRACLLPDRSRLSPVCRDAAAAPAEPMTLAASGPSLRP